MERKKIENMVEYCKNSFNCRECPYNEICSTTMNLLEIRDMVSSLPSSWSDEDIDYILDEINKEG